MGAGLVALGSATTLGEGLVKASVAAARDAVDVMAVRSPGERTQANLTKGKPRIDVGRVARALPRIRDARGSGQPPAAAALPGAVALPGGDAPLLLAGPAAAVAPIALAEAPGGVVGGPGGFFLPPLFGGGGGGGGGIIIAPPGEEEPEAPPPPLPGTPVTPPVVTTPVPEPATWAMMICGFAAAGAAIRMRRRESSRV